MEVEFATASEFTDDLTFKYYILVNGKLLTGEVVHSKYENRIRWNCRTA